MIINSARFVTSSPSVDKAPSLDKHEYAFIGRSNVGKSSLINMLTGKKGLAMTSSTPGKTMLINHFMVNDSWYIVDLPGYGFAQRSKADLARIDKMIRDYILYRPEMTNLFLLIDSRHEPQKIDLNFMSWLAENGVPFSIVFTKADKMSKAAVSRKVAAYCQQLLEEWEELPPVFVTSSNDRTGRYEILDYISQLNKLPLGGDPEADTDESTNLLTDTAMNKDIEKTAEQTCAEKKYPGAAVDASENDEVTKADVKDRTKVLNNNPRNTDDKMPG